MNDYRNGVNDGLREGYWTIGRIIPMILLLIVVGTGIAWISTGSDFILYKYWAPKQEQVRREVFEQTKSYNQGMIQELQNMQYQYVQADKAHKDALASIILHRAADFNPDNLPYDLRQFIDGLKRERGM